MYITNEIAWKLGFYDAYEMGSQDTTTDGWNEMLTDCYQMGYQRGLEEYATNHPESN